MEADLVHGPTTVEGMSAAGKTKLLFVSIAPPQNDCGVRVVMYRHLIEPFELMVATNADVNAPGTSRSQLRLPTDVFRSQDASRP